jgi:integrase
MFAYYTGWRIPSEVLPLQWAQIDRIAQTIRLESGLAKNREGRTLPHGLLPELHEAIEVLWHSHEELTAERVICPWVFHRNGKPIREFRTAWRTACDVASCPARLPANGGAQSRARGRP